jgi:hypothetical protein
MTHEFVVKSVADSAKELSGFVFVAGEVSL